MSYHSNYLSAPLCVHLHLDYSKPFLGHETAVLFDSAQKSVMTLSELAVVPATASLKPSLTYLVAPLEVGLPELIMPPLPGEVG